ncbi:MAG: cytochrome c biogenesis factor [Sphingomonadaceae bacterium]
MKAAPVFIVALGLAVGVGGYALTGNPGLPEAPAPRAPVDPRFTPEAEKASQVLLDNFGDARDWLTASDALIRAGRTETAIWLLDQATHRIPGNVDLWAQLGVAIVSHAEGEVVPAARLAFDRASRLDPQHPAPAYFLGLSWLQSGDPARALTVWRELDARTPPDAPWKPMLERLMRGATKMIELGVGANGPGQPG